VLISIRTIANNNTFPLLIPITLSSNNTFPVYLPFISDLVIVIDTIV